MRSNFQLRTLDSFSQIFPFETAEIVQYTRVQLELFEFPTYLFVERVGDQYLKDGKENAVFFLNVVPNSIRKAIRKDDEIGALPSV
jgi:hypothetical protein